MLDEGDEATTTTDGGFGADGGVEGRSSKTGEARSGEVRWYCWAGEGRLGVCCRGCWVGSTLVGGEGEEAGRRRRIGFDGVGEWDVEGGWKGGKGRRGRLGEGGCVVS